MKTSHQEDCFFYNLKATEYFKITRELFDLEWENFYSENLNSFREANQEYLRLPVLDPGVENFIVYYKVFYSLLNLKNSLKITGKFSSKIKQNLPNSM